MRYSNAEDYALPLTLIGALAIVVALHAPAGGLSLPQLAQTAEPDYRMTITAKRLPPECKTGGALRGTPACATLVAEAPRVEMIESQTQYAYLGACTVIDDAVAANALTQDQANRLIKSMADARREGAQNKDRIAAAIGPERPSDSPCLRAIRAL